MIPAADNPGIKAMPEHINEARASLYLAISEAFKEPSIKFVKDVVNGVFEREIKEAFQTLGHPVETEGLTLEVDEGGYEQQKERLVNQYYALFKGPFPPYVVPVESVYKPWAQGDGVDASVRDSKGYLMGDSAVEMLRRYELDGITIPKEYSCFPDHIALLMEYGGMLCIQGAEEAQYAFTLSHLDWLDDLRNEIHELTDNAFYRHLAEVCSMFGKLERLRFERNEKKTAEVA